MPSKINETPLAELVVGEHATVTSFAAERAVTNRLASLGFTPGAVVNMNHNYGRGPLIVIVRGSRVALGRGEATQIFVEKNTA